MPRESIYLPTPNTLIQVGWSKTYPQHEAVQLATLNDSQGEPYSPERGHFVSLDRASINRLINLLRKARDSAYGRDA